MVHSLYEVPLLSALPRVELAKLVSDITTITVAKGERVQTVEAQEAYVYLIKTGRIGVYQEAEENPLILVTLGAGEIIVADHTHSDYRFTYRAIEDTRLFRLERSRFNNVLAQHPMLLRQFSEAMVTRTHTMMDELARAKSALLIHAAEVWSMVEDRTDVLAPLAIAAETVESGPTEAAATERKAWHFPWRVVAVHGVPILAALAVLLTGQSSPVRSMMAILVWGVFSWLFDALPDYVVALTIGLAAGAFGIAKPEVALSGFASRTWFLLLAVLGISAGITRSGLLYRVALHMLRLFPPTYRGQSTALALGGLVLAPFLPGVTGRQAMASRLSLEVSEAMGYKQNSKGSAGLALACFLGFSCVYYISMTGGSVTLMVWSILPAAAKAGLSWSSWFFAALPVSVIVFVTSLMAVLRLYAPKEPIKISSDMIQSQLNILGPMRNQEWVSVLVVLAIVVAFITQPLHGLDPTWVALPGFLLLGATGVLDKDTLRKGIDWGFLLLTGGLFGIAALVSEGEFVKILSASVVPFIKPLSGNAWVFLTGVALLTTLIHLAIPFQPTILLLTLALAPVSAQLGYNPFVVGLVILIMASHFLIPVSNPMYMAAYGGSEGKAFTHVAARKFSLVHTVITLLAVWLCIPFWQWIGLL